ncbi:MAG: prephenate dehydratase [Desulfomonile tiedjei]|nr:prephenate dehydratase [Desulfomonile tiedjei]
MSIHDLENLRAQIDQLDREVLELLNRRMALSEAIGRLKAAQGQEVVDSDREEAILRDLVSLNSGLLPEKTLRAIYREIFSGSRALQMPLTVAFLGPAGTYCYDAAVEKFGHSASFIPCATVAEVFAEVNRGGVSFGVVPGENSIEGSVRETLDLLMTSSAGVCGEICLRISHALMNRSGLTEDIRAIVSHPQALAQCRQWLKGRFPGALLQESSSTAHAAEKAVEDGGVAAIANESLAARLGLKVIRRGIQDKVENITRFLILGDLKPMRTGNDKTSIVCWTEDRPGSLYRLLEKFAKYEVNLTRIESRPDRGAMPWKYAFLVDLEGHLDDPKIAECLQELSNRSALVKVLGSFPICSEPVSA